MSFIDLEKGISHWLRKYPNIRNYLVDGYQALFSIFPTFPRPCRGTLSVLEGYFFGFHDKTPWSKDNRMLLSHKIAESRSAPRRSDVVVIGYHEAPHYEHFVPIAETRTWNLQMGAMLQWFDENILFNDYLDGQNRAVLVTPKGSEVDRYDFPVAALSERSRYAVSHSFTRLATVATPYSYQIEGNASDGEMAPASELLRVYDLETGSVCWEISVAQIIEIDPLPSFNTAFHYFSHPQFNTIGDRFVFFHRWVTSTGQTFTRMYSVGINGDDLHLFDLGNTVTHTAWLNADEIFFYGYHKQWGSHYYWVSDKTNNFHPILIEGMEVDGHPNVSRIHGRIVTDTYPNRKRIQALKVFDPDKSSVTILAEFRIPNYFRRDLRCDFHPRWDRQGSAISFDSAHTGLRAHCVLNLENRSGEV